MLLALAAQLAVDIADALSGKGVEAADDDGQEGHGGGDEGHEVGEASQGGVGLCDDGLRRHLLVGAWCVATGGQEPEDGRAADGSSKLLRHG